MIRGCITTNHCGNNSHYRWPANTQKSQCPCLVLSQKRIWASAWQPMSSESAASSWHLFSLAVCRSYPVVISATFPCRTRRPWVLLGRQLHRLPGDPPPPQPYCCPRDQSLRLPDPSVWGDELWAHLGLTTVKVSSFLLTQKITDLAEVIYHLCLNRLSRPREYLFEAPFNMMQFDTAAAQTERELSSRLLGSWWGTYDRREVWKEKRLDVNFNREA